MNDFAQTATAFVEMAHRIVWSSASTVDALGRPRTRILHPIWQWDGVRLVGWIGTSPTWAFDDETRTMVWNLFLNTPEPLGYNPRIIPAWESPTCNAFAVIRLDPWRLRVLPGTALLRQGGELLKWRQK